MSDLPRFYLTPEEETDFHSPEHDAVFKKVMDEFRHLTSEEREMWISKLREKSAWIQYRTGMGHLFPGAKR